MISHQGTNSFEVVGAAVHGFVSCVRESPLSAGPWRDGGVLIEVVQLLLALGIMTSIPIKPWGYIYLSTHMSLPPLYVFKARQ